MAPVYLHRGGPKAKKKLDFTHAKFESEAWSEASGWVFGGLGLVAA
jgi:hypothetical protein